MNGTKQFYGRRKRRASGIYTPGRIHALSEPGHPEEAARDHQTDINIKLESLKTAPRSEEERQEILSIMRRPVETLVEQVVIGKDRNLQVIIRLNVLKVAS